MLSLYVFIFIFDFSLNPPFPQPPWHHINQIFRLYLYGCIDVDEEKEKQEILEIPEINNYAVPQFGSCPPLLDGWCCQRVEITLTVRCSLPPPHTYMPPCQTKPFFLPMHFFFVILVFNPRFIRPLSGNPNVKGANIADPSGNPLPPCPLYSLQST